ncbi:MAG: hypothetical protein II008_22595 [Oscillospiraceae bacterium]|nr:hypothetical protein [Oscillospiraceae bacterium]
MIRRYYTTSLVLTKVLSLILVLALALASYTVATEINRAHADTVYAKQWIICKNYVVIRNWPSRGAMEGGQLDPGDEIEIDGRTKDGFAHIVSPVDGWVWAGNIVSSQPEKVECKAYVTANKRLYCRRWVDGPMVDSKPYLINGSKVHVYWMNDEWAVTNRGYVRSEWLEMMP